MSKNQFQVDDIVSINARVTKIIGDEVVISLDTHLESPEITAQSFDVKLVNRPLKEGSAIVYGRKRAKGTFLNLATPTIAVVLVEGGNRDNASDLRTVDAVSVVADPDAPPAPPAPVAEAA